MYSAFNNDHSQRWQGWGKKPQKEPDLKKTTTIVYEDIYTLLLAVLEIGGIYDVKISSELAVG